MITIYFAREFMNNEMPYLKVASVNTVSLQHAYELTNNINKSWLSNEDITLECKLSKGVTELRSTSSGDVMIIDEGTENELVYFLVPMGNGPRGNKLYENSGETEVIDNFDINGFMYNGNHKIYSKDGGLMAIFKKPSNQEVS
tara:strand:+ start:1764 stop:2192 length:429 start_codon:yes stop_codon:yes gene_type:complete